MKPIERKIETLQDIAANIAGLLQAIQVIRGTADAEIETNGQISPATCVSMASLMANLHRDTAALHNGGHSVHQSMSRFVPEGGNEGQKSWPSTP